jgi:hypothetical protein
MEDRRLILTLHNRFHEDVFMGGDSSYFAPKSYYVVVQARIIQGSTDNEGYSLVFEEISDNCHATFRIREQTRQASVVQTFDGRTGFNIYLNRASAPSIRPGMTNKIAILAIQNDHWFYINNMLIGHCLLQRLPYARIDVGAIAGAKQSVTCCFQEFCVRVPSASQIYPELEHLSSTDVK